MKYKTLFFFNNEWYVVLDTDYTSYAIVYECSTNEPKFLNYRNDDIHIFTRSETVTDANMSSYKAKSEAKLSGSTARFETLEQKSCLPKSYFSKVNEMFTDPKKFFRKY